MTTIRTVHDEHGDTKLEVIRQPLYDTQYQRDSSYVRFFEEDRPAGDAQGPATTNVPTGGRLPWPKRFFASGLTIQFDAPLRGDEVKALCASLKVGEKDYYSLPLSLFRYTQTAQGPSFTTSWADPIKSQGSTGPNNLVPILPRQHFRVILDTNGRTFGETEIRCVLDGLLYREIC